MLRLQPVALILFPVIGQLVMAVVVAKPCDHQQLLGWFGAQTIDLLLLL